MNNVFLHEDLFKEVYMDLPLGYKPNLTIQGEKRVCKLHKSIYGLKQVSCQWFANFCNTSFHWDSIDSKQTTSLFIKGQGDNFQTLLVYIDDIIITGANIHHIQQLKNKLNDRFLLKDLGSLKFFLGLELAQSSFGLFLSQRHYALRLLEALQEKSERMKALEQ